MSVNSLNLTEDASGSNGSLPFGPNNAGKCSGIKRPRIKLASVTVNGPPERS